jgi:DNA-binding NarL/FixJ family response regulator
MSPTKVLLVDDHPIVRTGIRNLLERAAEINVVGEASDGFEALKLVEKLSPDVVLLDMEMPGMNGSEVAIHLKEAGSPVKILALSAHDDKQYIQELLANGASGYLTKEEVPEAIIEAVRGVARGEQGWVSRKIAAKMTTWMNEDSPARHKGLTPREVQVLKILSWGWPRVWRQQCTRSERDGYRPGKCREIPTLFVGSFPIERVIRITYNKISGVGCILRLTTNIERMLTYLNK